MDGFQRGRICSGAHQEQRGNPKRECPDGKNSEGCPDDFDFDLTAFKLYPVHEDTTVGVMYEETMLPLLRFLTTKRRCIVTETDLGGKSDPTQGKNNDER